MESREVVVCGLGGGGGGGGGGGAHRRGGDVRRPPCGRNPRGASRWPAGAARLDRIASCPAVRRRRSARTHADGGFRGDRQAAGDREKESAGRALLRRRPG